MNHELTTAWTTAELEARNTAEDRLTFAIDPIAAQKYHDDTDVIVTSCDGDVFIGHIDEVHEDDIRIYVILD